MENLSKALKALFVEMNGDEVLSKAGWLGHTPEVVHYDTNLPESIIVNRLLKVDQDSSIDQVMMLEQITQMKWMMPDDSCTTLKYHNSDSIYNILLYFASTCLKLKDNDPICRYRYLLRWHTLTTIVGEDLLTTSFLASHDIHYKQIRKNFDWDAFLPHDCKELNNLFTKPMAELHMHLKGSSFNFDLSWLCMMNNIEFMEKNFEQEHPYHKFKQVDNKYLYKCVKRAAAIRYYLAGAVGCTSSDYSSSDLLDELSGIHNEELDEKQKEKMKEIPRYNLQTLITNQYKKTLLKVKEQFEELKVKQNLKEELVNEDILDYISIWHYGNEPIENKALASERNFMYEVFKYIYNDNDNSKSDIATLFYAYLLYKNYFRLQILQLNCRVGFDNFASYEERKTDYMLDSYSRVLYKAAIEGFLEKGRKRNQEDIRYVEARIAPKDSKEKLAKTIDNICKCIKDTHDGHYDFIIHFIKKRDEPPKEGQLYRHFKLRHELKKQAYAIYNFRNNKKYKDKSNNLVGNVVGIDAANSEIFCRPEVFAQTFRFLRGHGSPLDDSDNSPFDLNITYHVGEDFLDIADGLRAVEEAIIYLNLTNGDRIGHGLVLGTDVRNYYKKHYNIICATKQVILDDLAWLHHKCVILIGYTPLCGWLEMMFIEYFNDIYRNTQKKGQDIIDSFFNEDESEFSDNIETYYLSWLLRGDSPTIGLDFDKKHLTSLTSEIDREWIYSGMNHHPAALAALRNVKARDLFDAYHTYKYVVRGNVADTLTIPLKYIDEWCDLLEKVQQDLLKKIESKHIAIECNPSSNYKIGEMERYDEHPIFKFFNYGLSTPYPRHDIAVSINTDDQGVFSTSLEREYSLIALAAERNQTKEHNNSPRDIIDWLERIRKMSIEQKF